MGHRRRVYRVRSDRRAGGAGVSTRRRRGSGGTQDGGFHHLLRRSDSGRSTRQSIDHFAVLGYVGTEHRVHASGVRVALADPPTGNTAPMKLWGILDRYLLREWLKVFSITTLGFPLIVIAIELTDRLDEYLARGLHPRAIATSYIFSLPEKIFMVLPAAVLFATVFSIGAMGRHSELTAAKATGRSFYRIVLPVFLAGLVVAVGAFGVGELAPPATRHQLELLGEKQFHAVSQRYNFVFRADQGWVYMIRSLDINERAMRDLVLEREGSGPSYPTLVIQAFYARYLDSLSRWTV